MTHKTIKTDNYILIVDENEKPIAHLPLNQAPILEGVDLLPPLEQEDNVEKLAEKEYRDFPNNLKDKPDWHYNKDINCHRKRKAYIKGYNKAREKYRFTEEDIDKAYWAGMKFIGEDKGSYEEFIQSLSQPKMPIGFECEMKCGRCYMPLNEKECWSAKECSQGSQSYPDKPITTTNSQGHKLWVGKWIY